MAVEKKSYEEILHSKTIERFTRRDVWFEDFSKIGPFREQSNDFRYVSLPPSDDRSLSENSGHGIPEEVRNREADLVVQQTLEHWINRADPYIHDQWMRILGRKNRVQTANLPWIGCHGIVPAVKGEYYVKSYAIYDFNEPMFFQPYSQGEFHDFALLNNVSNTSQSWFSILCFVAGHTLYTRKIRLRARRTLSGCAMSERCFHNRAPCHNPQIYLLWRKIRLLGAEIKKLKVDRRFFKRYGEEAKVTEINKEIEKKKAEIAKIKAERKELKKANKKERREYDKLRKEEIKEWIKAEKAMRKERKERGVYDEYAKKRTHLGAETREDIEFDKDIRDYFSDTRLRRLYHEEAKKWFPDRNKLGKPKTIDPLWWDELLHKESRGAGAALWGGLPTFDTWKKDNKTIIGSAWYVRNSSYFWNFVSSLLYYSGGYPPVPRPFWVWIERENLLDDFLNWLIMRVL